MSYAQPSPPLRRFGGVSFVILLHVGLVYALANGLGHKAIEVLKQPLETKIIQETKIKPPETPPPPPPKLAAAPPPFIPPPEIPVQQVAPPPTAIAVTTTVKPTEPPPQIIQKAEPVRIPPAIDRDRPCRPPEYPAASERLGEYGVTGLLFLIDQDGSVLEGKIDNSSGFPRLDNAALSALSRCKFKPGTLDGKPEQSWARTSYRWNRP